MWTIAWVVLTAATVLHAANILVFLPFPAKSHLRVIEPIADELFRRGHNITLFTAYENHDAPYKIVLFPNYMEKLRAFMGLQKEAEFMQGSIKQSLQRFAIAPLRIMGDYFIEEMLQEKAFQDFISSDSQFDLVIHESMFASEAIIGLQHRFKATSVELMTFGNSHWCYWLLGNPLDPSYIIDAGSISSDHMTFKERLENTLISLGSRMYWFSRTSLQQDLIDRYFRYPGWENRPPILEMISNISIVLVNTHYSLNYPYPMSPNFIEMAGTNILPNKPLPKEIKSFLDGAKDGAIYFTLGSHIQVSSTLGEKLRQEFAKSFSKLTQRVLWKWEADFPNVPENVMISKWFPQQDILAHPNVCLFITHGGFLSMTEAVYYGVPLIGIPILGDQNKNVHTFKTHGYGIHLDYGNLTEKSISWAINEILTNSRYKEKVMERSRLFRDQPMSPVNHSVYWIEYVLRNGGSHLRPAVTNLRWFQEALLDVYATLTALLLLAFAILYFTLKYMISFVKRNKITKEKTT